MLSRVITIPAKSYDGVLPGTAGVTPQSTVENLNLPEFVAMVRGHVEACRYNQALQAVVQDFLTPTNRYIDTTKPWSLVKTDKDAARLVLLNMAEALRIAAILLKPFIPRSAEAIYKSVNFPKPWELVTYADAATLQALPVDFVVTAELIEGKPKPLFPRIG